MRLVVRLATAIAQATARFRRLWLKGDLFSMTQKTQYLSCGDKKKIADFLWSYHQQISSIPNGPLYHYTTGENFIKIIQSGELWATQAACLNDTTELTYATEQILQRVKGKLSTPHNRDIDPALTWISNVLGAPGSEISPMFVACFSEQRDHLSQWRAYSGGEGGYAIQFNSTKLSKAQLTYGGWHNPAPDQLGARGI